MNILIDSNILYFWISDSSKIGKTTLKLLTDVDNEVYISNISVFELQLKQKKNKISKEIDFVREAKIEFSVCELSIGVNEAYANLSQIGWGDPFDHLIISQAIANNYTLITFDKNILDFSRAQDSIKCINGRK
jgi:PIN domain nuclease of toxin-antitoxin system